MNLKSVEKLCARDFFFASEVKKKLFILTGWRLLIFFRRPWKLHWFPQGVRFQRRYDYDFGSGGHGKLNLLRSHSPVAVRATAKFVRSLERKMTTEKLTQEIFAS